MELSRLSSKRTDSISTEDLLKALETQNTEESFSVSSPLQDFLTKFNITPGDVQVKINLLWKIFDKLNPNSLTRNVFTVELSLSYTMKANKFIYLNKNLAEYAQILKIKSKTNMVSNEANQKHFKAFLSNMNVTKGTYKIPSYVLYHIYFEYCTKNRKKIFSKPTFIKFADFFIDSKRGTECKFYLVNESTANLHQQKEFDGIKEKHAKRSKTEKD
jgi:hypothetical protein